jgi:hypothetical protein
MTPQLQSIQKEIQMHNCCYLWWEFDSSARRIFLLGHMGISIIILINFFDHFLKLNNTKFLADLLKLIQINLPTSIVAEIRKGKKGCSSRSICFCKN